MGYYIGDIPAEAIILDPPETVDLADFTDSTAVVVGPNTIDTAVPSTIDAGTLDRAGFTLRPSSSLGAGVEALVGTRTSGRTYRLPGSPIRAEALDIARGGIDTGAFGYGGWMPVNPDALVKVTTYTP